MAWVMTATPLHRFPTGADVPPAAPVCLPGHTRAVSRQPRRRAVSARRTGLSLAAMSVHVLHADNEWRFDPLDERWTLVAHNRRTLAPLEVALPAAERALRSDTPCVFCTDPPGGPLDRLTDDDGNIAVAFPSPTQLCFVEHPPPPNTPYARGSALGAHELLVPLGERSHGATLADTEPAAIALLLALALRRLGDLSGDERLHVAHVSFLPTALARLEHVHAALLALPHPQAPRSPCPACVDIEQARATGRIVFDEEGVVAWTPFAPRSDLHVRVAVAGHGLTFTGEPALLATRAVARGLTSVARALTRLAPGAPLAAASGPLPLNTTDGHLVVDLEVPFERDALLGRSLGTAIVTLAPEDTAARLRTALIGAAAAQV